MISLVLGTSRFETRILSLYPFFTLRCAETCLRADRRSDAVELAPELGLVLLDGRVGLWHFDAHPFQGG